MELPGHVYVEDFASLDQQQLLPVEATSSDQFTGAAELLVAAVLLATEKAWLSLQ